MFDTNETKAVVALGSNLPTRAGSPGQTLSAAIDEMARSGLRISHISHCYKTPCFPKGAGPDYANAAVALRAKISPAQLLERLHKIEADFGRLRRVRWGARALDLDLIAYGQAVLPEAATVRDWLALDAAAQRQRAPDRLILPHPRLQDRAFVLVPMADVAPDWVHPLLGLSVRQMLARLDPAERAEVVRLPGWRRG